MIINSSPDPFRSQVQSDEKNELNDKKNFKHTDFPLFKGEGRGEVNHSQL